MFQTIKMPSRKVTRTDCIWREIRSAGAEPLWRCVLCGAVCHQPPDFPTPKDWLPLRYDKLTAEDRALAPFIG